MTEVNRATGGQASTEWARAEWLQRFLLLQVNSNRGGFDGRNPLPERALPPPKPRDVFQVPNDGAAAVAGIGRFLASRGGTDGAAGVVPSAEPVFEPYTEAFQPLEKEVYTDAEGIQHRPVEVVIDRATYDDLVALGVDPETYVQDHVDRMNEILAESGVNIRVEVGAVRFVETMASEQRGPWNVRNSGNWPMTGGFDPAQWTGHEAERLDYAMLHEWGHTVLGLWDDYGFDIGAASAEDPFSPGTTLVHSGPAGLMGGAMIGSISEWGVLQLNQWAAQGVGYEPHRAVDVTPDEVPAETHLLFDPSWAGRPVRVHQSHDTGEGKAMNPEPVLSGTINPDGTFTFDSRALFSEILGAGDGSTQSHLSRSSSGTLLISVETPDGPAYFWMDLTDFVVAQAEQGDVVTVPLHAA